MISVKHRFTQPHEQHTILHQGAFFLQKQLGALLKTSILGSVALVFGWVAPASTIPLDSNASTIKAPTQNQRDAATKARVLSTYAKLPLRFEANQGQTDKQVNFLARGNGYSVFLTPTEAVLTLRQTQTQPSTQSRQPAVKPQPTAKSQTSVLRLQLVSSNPTAKFQGLEQLPGKSNYLLGKDSSKWHRDIVNYAKVQYQAVYPGIDLVYYGNQRQLEYDFVVAPGTNPKNIRLRVAGASRLEIDQQGNLLLHTQNGVIRQHRPIIYQEINGKKQAIAGGYVLLGKQEVGFKVAAYDQSQPLVIDPVVSYSTYLGGNSIDYGGYAVAVDTAGNVYVTGQTSSDDFPTKKAFDRTRGSSNDTFVTKLNPAKSGNASLVYSTYLGGSSDEYGYEIAVDLVGNAYVTGATASSDFPTLNAFDSTFGGNIDAFVTKLNDKGNALLYSTYLGDANTDDGRAIAVDKAGNAYVTGFTYSTDFPIKNAFDSTFGDRGDAFVTKLNPATSGEASLVYSSYLGGNSNDVGYGMAVDRDGNAYVTGYTYSTDFPTLNAFDRTFDGFQEAFVTKVNATGNTILYSTYLGGSGNELGSGIAVDTAGNVYVTGQTSSTDFPTLSAFDSTLGGFYDAFVTKLNPVASDKASLVYSTYLGGNEFELGYSLVVDKSGNAYVIGSTDSEDFPIKNAFDSTVNSRDAFVTKVNATGESLIYSSYLGGNNSDEGFGIAVDRDGNAYVTGLTYSTNFPTLNAFDSTLGGDIDAFVTKIVSDRLADDF